MIELKDVFPAKLMVFKGEDDLADVLVMAEVTDRGDETEFAWDWGGKRYYLRAKTGDLRAAVTVDGVK